MPRINDRAIQASNSHVKIQRVEAQVINVGSIDKLRSQVHLLMLPALTNHQGDDMDDINISLDELTLLIYPP